MAINHSSHPQHPGSIRFDAVSRAWRLMFSEPAKWPLATFLMFLLMGALTAPTQMLTSVAMQDVLPERPTPDDLWKAMASPQVQWISVLALPFHAISLAVSVGMTRMAIRAFQRGSVEVSDMFSFGGRFWRVVWVCLIIAAVGAIPWLAPLPWQWGWIVALAIQWPVWTLVMLAPILVLEQGLSTRDAFSRSVRAILPKWPLAFATVFVAGLGMAAGFLACCVGVLWTGALIEITLAAVYLDVFEPGAIVAVEQPPGFQV